MHSKRGINSIVASVLLILITIILIILFWNFLLPYTQDQSFYESQCIAIKFEESSCKYVNFIKPYTCEGYPKTVRTENPPTATITQTCSPLSNGQGITVFTSINYDDENIPDTSTQDTFENLLINKYFTQIMVRRGGDTVNVTNLTAIYKSSAGFEELQTFDYSVTGVAGLERKYLGFSTRPISDIPASVTLLPHIVDRTGENKVCPASRTIACEEFSCPRKTKRDCRLVNFDDPQGINLGTNPPQLDITIGDFAILASCFQTNTCSTLDIDDDQVVGFAEFSLLKCYFNTDCDDPNLPDF